MPRLLNDTNKLQTNGTLINDNWAKFFLENDFRVGVSLDGPKEFHDFYRKYPNGRGSYCETFKGINTLKKNRVPYGIIAVINKLNATDPDRMFSFFTRNNVGKTIAYNPCCGRSLQTGNLLEAAIEPLEFSKFIIRIFDLWMAQDDPDLTVIPLNTITKLLLGSHSGDCRFSKECEKFFVIDYDGEVYPCSALNFDTTLSYGNITYGFEKIFSNIRYQEYKRVISEIRQGCTKCIWYNICAGGCTRDYYLESEAIGRKNTFCKALKEIYSQISYRLKNYQKELSSYLGPVGFIN